jgi:hypothetical protein
MVFVHSQDSLSQDKARALGGKEPGTGRLGEPYYLPACPISNEKLGGMGEPVIKVYDGREVRFCCPACPPKFEKDRNGNFAKIDEQIIKDQMPLFPLKTSVISGKTLPEKPIDFVYANRLVRLLDNQEKDRFLKEPDRYLKELDNAVIGQQGKNYPLNTCVVSGDKFGGEMGVPKDVVLAGRLIRLCCPACKKDHEKKPAAFVAKVDAARAAPKKDSEDHEHHDGHDHKHEPHDH